MPKKPPLYPHVPKSQKKSKPPRDNVRVEFWEERDRLHIGIQDKETGAYYASWWDDEARQLFEDGFFKRGSELEESVLEYAEDMGILAKESGTEGRLKELETEALELQRKIRDISKSRREPTKLAGTMEVRLWTGTRIPVSDREEAVRVIERELEGWMEKGDRIAWYKKQETDPLPSIAYVMDSVGELTDASAIIVSKK